MSHENPSIEENLLTANVFVTGMKFHILWPFAFSILLLVSVSSCTKTVVQTQITTDTLRDINPQDAWVQFLSMFPDTVATEIVLSRTLDANSSLFSFASNSITGQYFPLRADTSYVFYLSSPMLPGWHDSLAIPAMGNTLNTFGLFLLDSDQGHPFISTQPGRTIDSEKLTPPPAGYCYVRFVNGVADASPASFDFDIDQIGNSLFQTNGHSQAILWGFFSPYGVVKAGTHTIFLRTPGTPDAPLELPNFNFVDGLWYTVRATGSAKLNNWQVNIDQE